MMILETFNKEWYERDLKEEGRQETLVELVRDGILSVSEAAKRLNIPEEEFKKLL